MLPRKPESSRTCDVPEGAEETMSPEFQKDLEEGISPGFKNAEPLLGRSANERDRKGQDKRYQASSWLPSEGKGLAAVNCEFLLFVILAHCLVPREIHYAINSVFGVFDRLSSTILA